MKDTVISAVLFFVRIAVFQKECYPNGISVRNALKFHVDFHAKVVLKDAFRRG